MYNDTHVVGLPLYCSGVDVRIFVLFFALGNGKRIRDSLDEAVPSKEPTRKKFRSTAVKESPRGKQPQSQKRVAVRRRDARGGRWDILVPLLTEPRVGGLRPRPFCLLARGASQMAHPVASAHILNFGDCDWVR